MTTGSPEELAEAIWQAWPDVDDPSWPSLKTAVAAALAAHPEQLTPEEAHVIVQRAHGFDLNPAERHFYAAGMNKLRALAADCGGVADGR